MKLQKSVQSVTIEPQVEQEEELEAQEEESPSAKESPLKSEACSQEETNKNENSVKSERKLQEPDEASIEKNSYHEPVSEQLNESQVEASAVVAVNEVLACVE